jgi:hypothetical protein
MNAELIAEATRETLAGTAAFPEVVAKLVSAGLEYYHVDYVGMRKTFYSPGGVAVVTSITYEGMPPVAPEFDAADLRSTIVDSRDTGKTTATSAAERWRREYKATSLSSAASGSPIGGGVATSTPNGFQGPARIGRDWISSNAEIGTAKLYVTRFAK